MYYTGYIRALVFAIYMCQAQARGPCVMCSELGCSCSCTCIYLLVCGTGRPREGDPTSCTLYGFNSARRQHTATRPHRASAARDADHGRLPAAYSQRPLSCNLAQSQLSTRRERSPPASRAVRAPGRRRHRRLPLGSVPLGDTTVLRPRQTRPWCRARRQYRTAVRRARRTQSKGQGLRRARWRRDT